MGTEQSSDLFDLAVRLDGASRATLIDLADQGEPGAGARLSARLLEFERFQALLNQDNAIAGMLTRYPPSPQDADPLDEDPPMSRNAVGGAAFPERLGQHRIEREIKRGGQGVVYLASQETTGRQVALKLISRGPALHPDDRARFARELQALAMMNHDHIAAIFEAGETAEGVPFFSMEYVDGTDIFSYCQAKQLSLRQRLALFVQVCQGVAHAHQRLILHRDLKPSNVLVADVDGRPRVKIVDFGIARSLDRSDGADQTLTHQRLVGTPGYMAPEMFGAAEPDTRLDVYALGVLLYALAVGKAPLNPPDHLSLDEKYRYYREREPPSPSSQLPGKANGELDAIVLKAMAKDPDRRYASALELERDCRAFLANRPVSARPPSWFYQAKKLIARNKTVAGAAALALLALVVGLAGTLRAERKAQTERRRFEASFETLRSLLATPDPYQMGAQARVIDALRTRETALETSFEGDQALESMIREVLGNTYLGLGFFREARGQLERSLAIMDRNHGSRDPRVLEARRLLAMAALREGDRDTAEHELTRIYDLYPTSGYDEEKLRVLAGLSDVYQDNKEADRAEALLPQMARHLAMVADGPARARGLFTLANIHHGLGSAEAKPLYRESLAILNSGGEPNPLALAVMGSLANHLRRHDLLTESEALYRELIDLRVQRQGEGHFLTQHARAALALCLADQGRHVEAEPLIVDVAQTLAHCHAGHPETLAMVRRMAGVYRRAGKLERAEQLLLDLTTYYRDNGLSQSPDALKTRSNLADALIMRGAYRQAADLLAETIADMTAAKGPADIMTIAAMVTLGQAQEGLGDRAVADATYKRAVDLLATRHPDRRELPYYRAIRANNLTAMQRFEEAEAMLLSCLDAAKRGSAIYQEIRKYLAAHYRARGNHSQAAAYAN